MNDQRNSSGTRRLYLAPFAVLLGAVLVLQIALIVIDPFSEYSWTEARDIPADSQTPDYTPFLLKAAAKADYDTVVLGGSTIVGFRPDDVAEIYDDADKVVNLSYSGSRPGDLKVAYGTLADHANLKRVITSFDYNMMLAPSVHRARFPWYLFEDDFAHKFRATNMTALRTSLSLTTQGTLADSTKSYRIREAQNVRVYKRWMRPSTRADMAAVAQDIRSEVMAPAQFDCGDFESIDQIYLPWLERMQRKGVDVDVIIPPYASVFYYTLRTHPALSKIQPSLEDHLALRRCFLQAAETMPNVRIFAFDTPELIADWSKYRDGGHIYNHSDYRAFLDAMARGQNRLTLADFPAYADGLRETVAEFGQTEQ